MKDVTKLAKLQKEKDEIKYRLSVIEKDIAELAESIECGDYETSLGCVRISDIVRQSIKYADICKKYVPNLDDIKSQFSKTTTYKKILFVKGS